MASFWKPEACGQTALPDRSVLIGQKLVENAKNKNSNATFWVIFKQYVAVVYVLYFTPKRFVSSRSATKSSYVFAVCNSSL